MAEFEYAGGRGVIIYTGAFYLRNFEAGGGFILLTTESTLVIFLSSSAVVCFKSSAT